MAKVSSLQVGSSSLRKARLTIRGRLTLSYAGLVTGCGAALIGIVYLYMRFVPSYDVVPVEISQGLQEANEVTQATDGIEITSAEDFLSNLLTASLIALFILSIASGVVGWIVAGRIVRPLQIIGAAARRASTGALDHRIDLDGPHDEIRVLAETVDQMLTSLERSFDSYRRFAANASHELRTPLTTTKTMLDVTLGDPFVDTADLRALAERIREINSLNIETVDALLDLAAADNDSTVYENIDLEDLVSDAVEDLSEEARQASVLINAPRGRASAFGNPALLRQLVSNLLRNAIRHNYPSGHASLQVTALADRARLTITNTGPTLNGDKVAELTEPFVRGEGRIVTRDHGRGLGLALVATVIRAHAGNLDIRPNTGGGLTVVVDIPHAPDV